MGGQESEVMARKTKAEAEKTRKLLLQKAAEVFLEKGIVATSLQDIATAAGMTRGAVYWHFENKAAVLQALLEQALNPIFDFVQQKLEQGNYDNPLDALREIMRMVLLSPNKSTEAYHAFQLFFHYYSYRYIPELDDFFTVYFDCSRVNQVQKLFVQAQAQGLVRQDVSTDVLVFSFKALMSGTLSAHLEPDSCEQFEFDLVKEVDVLIDCYLRGIQA